ncbi:MAG: NUDIX domain-containing protein [Candidatus Taylorbacteria bacterium]|nr:NUDIX domain-containing protein [Candidatus Taylorbacteria bacterium]
MSNTESKKDSEVLMVLRDKDIFSNVLDDSTIVWKIRPTGKVVLFNKDGLIALMGNKVNNFFLLPGGGIGDDEPIIEGVKRECKEETGCEIEIQNTLGITEDFRARDKKHCISYGYTAKVISQGINKLTESELDIGAYVKWVTLDEAITIFNIQEEKVKASEVKFYNTCFNIFRDSLFIRLTRDLTKK